MAETILVNFRRSIPLFPLLETVLLPHALLPLHIFESRYRQMVRTCLDRAGQIAIATIGDGSGDADDAVHLRPVVCVGQIIHHEALPNGRFNIWLHGVCRAQIKQVIEPDDERRYRLARLVPLDPIDGEPEPMPEVRELLRRRLSGPSLRQLRDQNAFLEWIERDDVPTQAVLELIGSRLLPGADLKYRMLAETDPHRRARLVIDQLEHFRRILLAASRQNVDEWPKGVSWN